MSGELVADAGAFNVNRLKELIPTVQFYSTNPRNSAINIRGLGAPFGLTNDGIEPGVGLYIDGVFYARPAAATLDFLDVERVEVLRGPQGTLFGKNTTAGAINVTTRKPTLHAARANVELNYGNFGFVQAKASVSGRSADKVAGRVSFSGTSATASSTTPRRGDDVNDLNNLGVRGQVLFAPSDTVGRQRRRSTTRGSARGLHAGGRRRRADAAPGQPAVRADRRRPRLHAAELQRVRSADRRRHAAGSPTRISAAPRSTIDWKVGPGRLTSTTAWRYWDWNPSNDRDFIGLPVTTISAAPSKQRQWTQEVRYAGDAVAAR